MTSPSPDSVLIVGGGLAGLCCARHLHQQGVPVALFEADTEVGGRVRTDHVDGFLLDRGFQVLLTAYEEAQHVLDYPALQLQPFQPGALIRVNGRLHLMSDPFRRPTDILATLRSPVGTFSDKCRVGLLRFRLSRMSLSQLFEGDDESTDAWLRREGFSDRMIDRFFRPFLGGVFLDRDLGTTSRMGRFVMRMFASGDTAVPRDGMGAIARQLRDGLPDSSIWVSAPVVQVEKTAITLRGGERVKGVAVVIAADAEGASRLEPDLPPRAWSGVSCLYFDAPRSPLCRPILVLNGEGEGLVNNLHVVSQVNPASAPPGRALVSVTVLNEVSTDALESAVRDELAGWFGETVRAWRHLRTYRIPHALPAQPPGTLDPGRRPARAPSGVYRCGDHLCHASIQGAMESGRQAAEAILEDRVR